MNDTQLQIVLSLLDNASEQLQEAQAAFQQLGEAGTEAAAQITNALTPAEEAVVAQAQQAAEAWSTATDDIVADFEDIVPTADEALTALGQANLAAAQAVSDAWATQSQAMEDDLAAAMAGAGSNLVPAATAAGEAAGSAAGTGFAGYFKKMIIGYGLEQIGSFLSGGIDSAIAAASKSQDTINQLTAEIDQQNASIAVNDAALQKWTGTTAEVNAAHEKAAANIQAEQAKIQELNQQLAPLTQSQQGLTGSIQETVNSVLAWIGSQPQLNTAIQTFTTTLGPMIQYLGYALIAVTLLKVAMSVLDGPMLILIALAVVTAGLVTVWQSFHTQITAFFDDLNDKTGILTLFEDAWQSISQTFNENLKPALEQLWTALQPLAPYLQAMAIVFGATLVAAIELLVAALTIAIDLFTDILTVATKVATFFTNVFVVALNAVQQAIQAIVTLVSKVGSVGGAIGSAITSTLSHIPAFATGGIVNSPTLALVGEAGPEAIIPLSAFAGGSSLGGTGGFGSGGNIVVNINGGSYLDQNGAQQIAAALARQIGMQLKLRNFV